MEGLHIFSAVRDIGFELFLGERIPFVVGVSSEILREAFPEMRNSHLVEASDPIALESFQVVPRKTNDNAKVSNHRLG